MTLGALCQLEVLYLFQIAGLLREREAELEDSTSMCVTRCGRRGGREGGREPLWGRGRGPAGGLVQVRVCTGMAGFSGADRGYRAGLIGPGRVEAMPGGDLAEKAAAEREGKAEMSVATSETI